MGAVAGGAPPLAPGPRGTLDAGELAAFKRDGFFIRRGIIPPELCAAARDRLWELNETTQLDRADPSSWVGPLTGGDLSGESSNARTAYRWNCRVPGGEDVLKDALPRNPIVLAIVKQLLGWGRVADPLSEQRGTRGVYCTLPMGDKNKSKNSCHIDDYVDSRGRIACVAYIDDVRPGAGSFTVWPGSHHKFYRYLSTREDGVSNGYDPGATKKNGSGGPDSRPTWALGMQAAWDVVEANTTPVDCWGSAGTVVFYHNNLGHMAGSNYGDNIRQATLTGFGLTEEALPDQDLLAHALNSDIWRDWSAEVQGVGDDFGTVGDRAGAQMPDTRPMWYARGKL